MAGTFFIDDLLTFFDTEEFGVSAQFTHGCVSVEVPVLMEAPFEVVALGGATVASEDPAASGTEPPADLTPSVITDDVIQVIVNPSNTVTKLNKEQLKGLSTGKIQNWKDAGGPDQPVVVVTSHSGSATRKVFQKIIMDGEAYAAGAIEVETTRKEVDTVNLFPEGLGAVSQGFVNLPGNKEKVKIVETQKISRPLMFITKGAPSADVQKVIDFFKGEGKKYIKD